MLDDTIAAESLFFVIANNRPGCSSLLVCVRHCFVDFAGVFINAGLSGSILDESFFEGNGVVGRGVRAGKIEDVVGGFGNDDDGIVFASLVTTGAPTGRIGGGIPGGRFIIGETTALLLCGGRPIIPCDIPPSGVGTDERTLVLF